MPQKRISRRKPLYPKPYAGGTRQVKEIEEVPQKLINTQRSSYPDPYAGGTRQVGKNRFEHLPYEPSPEALEALRKKKEEEEGIWNKFTGAGSISSYEPPPPPLPLESEDTALASEQPQPWGGSYRPATASRPDQVRRYSNMPESAQDPTVGHFEEKKTELESMGQEFTPENRERFINHVIDTTMEGRDPRTINPYQMAAEKFEPDLYPQDFQRTYAQLKARRDSGMVVLKGLSDEWEKRASMQQETTKRKELRAREGRKDFVSLITKKADMLKERDELGKFTTSPNTETIGAYNRAVREIDTQINAYRGQFTNPANAKAQADRLIGLVESGSVEPGLLVEQLRKSGQTEILNAFEEHEKGKGAGAPAGLFISPHQKQSALDIIDRLGKEAARKGLTGPARTKYIQRNFTGTQGQGEVQSPTTPIITPQTPSKTLPQGRTKPVALPPPKSQAPLSMGAQANIAALQSGAEEAKEAVKEILDTFGITSAKRGADAAASFVIDVLGFSLDEFLAKPYAELKQILSSAYGAERRKQVREGIENIRPYGFK
ncbi:MAG: hypothetical protein U1C57_02000 [Candidatus Doudnabacteria bacterium]|nr:hypothetical protein [Candidatus Doudnabacteria bacterium]